MTRLAKLTQLFMEGTEIVIEPPGGGEMTFWINKLSPFESEACTREGRVARSRRMLAIKEIGTAEYTLFEGSAAVSSDAAIIDSMVNEKANDHFLEAARGLRSDPKWSDKVEVLEHTDEAEITEDAEVEVLAKLAAEYGDELNDRIEVLRGQLKRELEGMTTEDLREQYKASYVEQEGLRAFIEVQRRWQIYYALRECAARQKDGGWDHAKCDHRERTLATVEDVLDLPEQLLVRASEAMQKITMSPDLARFTAALASSSVSSGSSSSAEDSKPSGPEGASTELATTSS